jgi:hypothetical protein
MKKYEYKYIIIENDIEKQFNELGNDGWKLFKLEPFRALFIRETNITIPVNNGIGSINRCVMCHGTGRVPNGWTTSGEGTCPSCHGTGSSMPTFPQVSQTQQTITPGFIPWHVVSTTATATDRTVSRETFEKPWIDQVLDGLTHVDEKGPPRVGKDPDQWLELDMADRIRKNILNANTVVENNSESPLSVEENNSTQPEVSGNNIPKEEYSAIGVPGQKPRPKVQHDTRSFSEFLTDEGIKLEPVGDKSSWTMFGWTTEQQKSLYEAIAGMNLYDFVPFSQGNFLYYPVKKPPMPLSPVAEAVHDVSITKTEPKKPYQSLWEQVMDERTKAAVDKFGISFPISDADFAPKKSIWELRKQYKEECCEGYDRNEVVPEGARTYTMADIQRLDDRIKEVENMSDVFQIADTRTTPGNYYPPKQTSVENNSSNPLSDSEQNSTGDDLEEYYSLPVRMADILKEHASYKDLALVTVRWSDVKTVVEKLGDQAPVEWQLTYDKNRRTYLDFGYAATMADLRDAQQTMIDLSSMWAANKLTAEERAEEHIEQDWTNLSPHWQKLVDVYPAQGTDVSVKPYFDDYDPTKKYSKVLFKPGASINAKDKTPSPLDPVPTRNDGIKNILKRRSPLIGDLPDDSGC